MAQSSEMTLKQLRSRPNDYGHLPASIYTIRSVYLWECLD